MERNYRTKEILWSLCGLPKFLPQLDLSENEKLILDEVLKYADDDERMPSGKELYTKLGLKNTVFTKTVQNLYKRVLKMIAEKPLLGEGNVVVEFCIPNPNEFLTFYYKLPFAPRVGDEFNFYFLKAASHLSFGNCFYVDSIEVFLSEKCEVRAYCKNGIFNAHEKMIEEKGKYEKSYSYLTQR